MPVRSAVRCLVLVSLHAACSDPYEGGGRRTTLPTVPRNGGVEDSGASQAGSGGDERDAGGGYGIVIDGGVRTDGGY